jgi:cyanophycinase-like exopeptidase
LVVMFGSGETSPHARPVYDELARRHGPAPRIAVLETPAGFELNSDRVAGRVAAFIGDHLRHLRPTVTVIPARQRGTPFSPDDPQIVAPLLDADIIFFGPGSPTYTVRQLRDTLAWHILRARHRLGATLVLASAATIASGSHALPVYEIYKVGADLHWQDGLALWEDFGLPLVFVPHWNNGEGGAELDTSRCFMGQARFAALRAMLPSWVTVVGIDELTALVADCAAEECRVMGHGQVTLLQGEQEQSWPSGATFPLSALGTWRSPRPAEGIPAGVWDQVRATADARQHAAATPPPEVLALAQEREAARQRRDWAAADALRGRAAALGWQINDTPGGPQLSRLA